MSVNTDGPAGSARVLTATAPIESTGDIEGASSEASPATTSRSAVSAENPDAPTMGVAGVLAKVQHKLNPNGKPPKLGKKEQAIRDAEALQAENLRQAELEAIRKSTRFVSLSRLRHLSDLAPHFTTVYIGVKGAAATTTTMAYAVSVKAEVTRTIVYAADFNPASGTAGTRFGKNPEDSVTIRKFSEMVESLGENLVVTPSVVNSLLRATPYGVRVLLANDYTLVTTEQFGTMTDKMLKVLTDNSDYLDIDTPNDITSDAAQTILEQGDVFVFTANVNEPESLRAVYTAMENVRQVGHREKVANSIVLISNIPEGVELEEYGKYLHRTDIFHEILQRIEPAEFQGRFLGVPHDPAVAKAGVVDLEALGWDTHQAYIDLDLAVFEQAIRLQQPRPSAPPVDTAPAVSFTADGASATAANPKE